MFGVKDLKGLAESLDKFNATMLRIAAATEQLARDHKAYVEMSRSVMSQTMELQRQAAEALEPEEPTGNGKGGRR